MSEHARNRASRFAVVLLSTVFLIAAGYSWLAYVGQGIAYGDLFGVTGREADLAVMARRARDFLAAALSFEALAVAIIAWLLSDEVKPVWQRLCFSVVLASVADFFTYAVVRGF